MLKNTVFLLSIVMLFSSCGAKKEIAIIPDIEKTINLDDYKTLINARNFYKPSKEYSHFETIINDFRVRIMLGIYGNEPIKADFLSKVLDEEGINGQFLIVEVSKSLGFKNYLGVSLIEPFSSETLFSATIETDKYIERKEIRALQKALQVYIHKNSTNTNPN